MSQTNHPRRAVSRVQQHIQDIDLTGIGQGFRQRLLKLLLRSDHNADAPADQITDPFVVPVVKVVEGSFEDFTFGRIPPIVQHNHDRGLLIAHRSREFRSRHLKRAIADQDDGTKRWISEGGAD